jgi:tRNA (guanine37-N1)-methyltransferase
VRIDIMTLFPDSMRHVLGESILGRAAAKGIIELNCVQIRDYTTNKQCQVDDYPYGGGWGCVMMAQPLKSCLDDILDQTKDRRSRVIYMSPQGKPFNQTMARRLKNDYDHLVLICGHYEGIDERFIEACVDEEISIGDFVLTGGELPAMVVADAVCRMVPGVLADEECFTGESHWDGLLEYPQYTRPEVWEGRAVPPVLLSGNHANVARWRRKQSLARTMDKRPDLFEKLKLTDKTDRRLLDEILEERKEPEYSYEFDYSKAIPFDLQDITRLVEKANGKGQKKQKQRRGSKEQQYQADIAAGNCWVFYHEGKPVGVFTIQMGETVATVQRLVIDGHYQKTPLRKEMLDFAEALALGKGKRAVRIEVADENNVWQGLSEQSGYTCMSLAAEEVQEPACVVYKKEL